MRFHKSLLLEGWYKYWFPHMDIFLIYELYQGRIVNANCLSIGTDSNEV